MDEATLVTKLLADPTEEDRLIYADWLDEHGEAAKAEFLRNEVALHRSRDRLRALAPTLDSEWLATVSRHQVLEVVGFDESSRIDLIRALRDVTGRTVPACAGLLQDVPFRVFGGLSSEFDDARRRLEEAGAELAVRPTPGPWLGELTGRGVLELRAYGDTSKIRVIKAIREGTGLGLRRAKELSEALPSRLEGPWPRIRDAYQALTEMGAEVRWVVPGP